MITQRPRRLRRNQAIREMVRETSLSPSDLIAPLFVTAGRSTRQPIVSMPGQFRLGLDELIVECRKLSDLGVAGVALFAALDDSLKDSRGTHALDASGLYPEAISAVKQACPKLLVMSDVALDPYSSDGHDGLVDPDTGVILNDETLEVLAQMAVVHAQAGADLIGPSDMMDGRVAALRRALDGAGFSDRAIISYTAKYASHFYGPFREALDSAPRAGDKKTYQMDFANIKEALREAQLDEAEGADILMVKPGLAYLDVLHALSKQTTLPLAAYQVSGEYAMVKAASAQGWVDGPAVMLETLWAFKRAGARLILTYFAREAAEIL